MLLWDYQLPQRERNPHPDSQFIERVFALNKNSTNRGSLWFSQACLIIFALLLLALDLRGFWIIRWFLGVSHGLGGLRDGICLACTLYSCSVCAWIAVVVLWWLLRLVAKGSAFSPAAVRCLRITGWCCFAVAALTLASTLYYLPMVLPALCAGFMGAIVRIVMSAFESALSMREELDLTV